MKMRMILKYILAATIFSSVDSKAQTISQATDFYWGVSNSAFQVEGSPLPSDWSEWTREKNRIKDQSTAQEAAQFWTRYEEDFTLARNLGVNGFRLSIAWERVEPTQGKFNQTAIDVYKKMILSLRKKNIEPFVTLHHFVNPLWLAEKGGLTAPDFAESFTRYALKMISELSAEPYRVKYFFTFNEPMVLINASYLEGIWPPGKKDPQLALQAAASLSKAHILTYRKLHTENPQTTAQLSIAKHWRVFEPKGILGTPLAGLSDWFFNRQILKSLLTSKIYFWMPGASGVSEDLAVNEQSNSTLDFLGINYYGRLFVEFQWKPPFVKLSEGPGVKSDLGWEIYPKGLFLTLQDASRYKLPLVVSENGVADAEDSKRSSFIQDHVNEMMKAKKEGAPVFGYFHWSLTDNFEWAEGLHSRFGLVGIDYQTQKRSPRKSYFDFQKIIQEQKSPQPEAKK